MWRRYGDASYGMLVLAVVTAEVVALGALTFAFSLGLVSAVPGWVPMAALVGTLALTGLALVALTAFVIMYHWASLARDRRHQAQVQTWTQVWVQALYAAAPPPAPPLCREAREAALRLRELLRGDEGRSLSRLLEGAGLADDLVRQLSSRRRIARLEALEDLARARLERAMGALLQAMRSRRPGTRLMAARAAARTLAVWQPGPERARAAAALAGALVAARLPAGAVGETFLLLEDAAPPVIERLLAAPALPVPLARASVDAIGWLHLADLQQRVADMLRHPSPEVRAAALRALTRISSLPPESRGAVRRALDDETEFVRIHATRAATLLPRRDALGELWHKLGDPSWWVRRAAAESLLLLGPPGRRVLVRAAAAHSDRFARDMAAQALRDAEVAPASGTVVLLQPGGVA